MLCSVELVKKRDIYGIINDEMLDDEIEAKIKLAETFISMLTGGRIFEETYKEYYSDDMNICGNKIYLPQTIIRIESCDDFGEIPIRYEEGKYLVVSTNNYKFSPRTVVKGTFGYKNIPLAVKEATALMTIDLFENENDTKRDSTGESVSGFSFDYGDEYLYPSEVKRLLTNYKRKPYMRRI